MLKLQVIGNIGQDARVNDVNGSKSVNFSIAHNEKYTDKDGVINERTSWVNCTFWRKDNQSVEVAKYLTAGTKVYVEGNPSVQTYQDKQNKTQVSLNLNVTSLELVGGNKEKSEAKETEAVQEATEKPKL